MSGGESREDEWGRELGGGITPEQEESGRK